MPESLQRDSASHASDIPFFMNTQAQKYGDKTTPAIHAAGKAISSYVVKFVKADPKNPQIEGWSRYQRRDGKMMDFSARERLISSTIRWGAEIDAAPPARLPGMALEERRDARAGGGGQ